MFNVDTATWPVGVFEIETVSMPNQWVIANTQAAVPWARFFAPGGLTLVATAGILNAMIRPVVWSITMRERLLVGPATTFTAGVESGVLVTIEAPKELVLQHELALCGLEYRGNGIGYVRGASLWFEARRRYVLGSQTSKITGG